MTPPPPSGASDVPSSTENQQERLNREPDQLLQGLRVALPGVQVLFAFLLIAPSVHHRLRLCDGIKEEMIRMANLLTSAGAVCLGLTIGAAPFVVGDSAFSTTPARWIGPAVVLLATYTCFILPLRFLSGQTATR